METEKNRTKDQILKWVKMVLESDLSMVDQKELNQYVDDRLDDMLDVIAEHKEIYVPPKTDHNPKQLQAMSLETLEKIVEELEKKRPKWMYKRPLIEYKAWLEYYKATKSQKLKLSPTEKRALSTGAVCCALYFFCWCDPAPYERGACCKHMGDKTLCKGCTDAIDKGY